MKLGTKRAMKVNQYVMRTSGDFRQVLTVNAPEGVM